MDRLDNDILVNVVNTLVGPIEPYADSAIDKKRLGNLEQQIYMADALISQIVEVAQLTTSPYRSVQEIANKAQKFLDGLVSEVGAS